MFSTLWVTASVTHYCFINNFKRVLFVLMITTPLAPFGPYKAIADLSFKTEMLSISFGFTVIRLVISLPSSIYKGFSLPVTKTVLLPVSDLNTSGADECCVSSIVTSKFLWDVGSPLRVKAIGTV